MISLGFSEPQSSSFSVFAPCECVDNKPMNTTFASIVESDEDCDKEEVEIMDRVEPLGVWLENAQSCGASLRMLVPPGSLGKTSLPVNQLVEPEVPIVDALEVVGLEQLPMLLLSPETPLLGTLLDESHHLVLVSEVEGV